MKTARLWHIAAFLAPAVLVYSLFSALPLIDTLRLSLFATDDAGVHSFVGLDNYRTILFDSSWSVGFWNAMWNNLKFFMIHMLLQNPIGLLLATLLSLKDLRGARTYRTLIFLPTLLSVVIIGFIWQLILSPLWGRVVSLGPAEPEIIRLKAGDPEVSYGRTGKFRVRAVLALRCALAERGLAPSRGACPCALQSRSPACQSAGRAEFPRNISQLFRERLPA